MEDKSIPARPPFDSLPLDSSGPPGNAWGLYGIDDELGALNLLTPNVVASAASEIQIGTRVSLDWDLDKPAQPNFSRAPFQWKMLPNSSKKTINDDEVHFNTQSGSQWDGFRHFGYQGAKRFYGNRSQADIESSRTLGIDAWVKKGGIVGRGVLLDYVAFCERHSIELKPHTSCPITLDHIHQMAKEQQLEFKQGDILLIRSGFIKEYNVLDPEAQAALALRKVPEFIGIDPTIAMLRWIWETGFSAVAGDTISFEQAPVEGTWVSNELEDNVYEGGMMHQVLLGGWGVPIGELFDLEELAKACQKHKRWSFFFTSVPLRVPGGVASPPNAVAVF